MSDLVDKAQALVDALDRCKPGIDAAFSLSWVHGQRYDGPTYNEEREALREALRAPVQEDAEPVLWVEPDDFSEAMADNGFYAVRVCSAQRSDCSVPLFAHPPQQSKQATPGSEASRRYKPAVEISGEPWGTVRMQARVERLEQGEPSWQTVAEEGPRRHRRHEVRRDGFVFTATPCYGMHAPWWVQKVIDESGLWSEGPPFGMLDTDEWRALAPATEPEPVGILEVVEAQKMRSEGLPAPICERSGPEVLPENCWREVWHQGCNEHPMPPMKHLRERLEIEDGSVLRLFECTGCGVRLFAGLNSKRRIVSRPEPESPAPVDGEKT